MEGKDYFVCFVCVFVVFVGGHVFLGFFNYLTLTGEALTVKANTQCLVKLQDMVPLIVVQCVFGIGDLTAWPVLQII